MVLNNEKTIKITKQKNPKKFNSSYTIMLVSYSYNDYIGDPKGQKSVLKSGHFITQKMIF